MLVIIVVYYGHFATEVAKIVAKSEAFCNLCNPVKRSVTRRAVMVTLLFHPPAPITHQRAIGHSTHHYALR